MPLIYHLEFNQLYCVLVLMTVQTSVLITVQTSVLMNVQTNVLMLYIV